MGKFINKEILEKRLSEQDKDLIIADLTKQLADAQLQINDMSMIIANLQLKVGV